MGDAMMGKLTDRLRGPTAKKVAEIAISFGVVVAVNYWLEPLIPFFPLRLLAIGVVLFVGIVLFALIAVAVAAAFRAARGGGRVDPDEDGV